RGDEGPMGQPGEVSQAAHDGAIAGTAQNPAGVDPLVWEPSDPPTADDYRIMRDKFNEHLNATKGEG
ncbi:MAG TPA: hypothetical protein VI454_05550, partial [Verrucomicrobiae bacterium]